MTDAGTLSAEDRLRKEIAGLPVDEILALCYTFANKLQRLTLYLGVLHEKGGQRAQFASCLICFDLGRQGVTTFQRDFAVIAETVRVLATNEQLVAELVGDDPYLSFIWELLEAQLEEMDTRFGGEDTTGASSHSQQDVGSLDLLSDDDFADLDDLDIEVDEPKLRAAFDEAVAFFLGAHRLLPAYDAEAGFRIEHRDDVERIDRFLMELDSLREPVPMARGYRALTLLFYGTHIRSRNIFGTINQRKQTLLREGLEEFTQSGDYAADIAGIFGTQHSDEGAWQKIAEVILDYASWLSRQTRETAGIENYDAVERQVKRDKRRGSRRRSEREL